jgi:acyl dehydratase
MTSETKTRALLYFEDLWSGQMIHTGGNPVSVDAEAIKTFARQFDQQPFHLDEAKAANTFFRGLVASGWHTTALTMKLMVDGGVPLAGGIIGAGVDELRWPQPVKPGDRLHVMSEVLEIRPLRSRPDQGLAKVRVTTLNQNNEPVQVMTCNLVVLRRGS